MGALLSNNAVSRLASSLTTGSTSLSVSTGQGARFPSPSAGDWFPMTIVKSSGVLEIVRCTARSGDVFTVVRARESTLAQAFAAGDRVELRATAAVFDEQAAAAKAAHDAADAAQEDVDQAQAEIDALEILVDQRVVKKDANTTTGAALIPTGNNAQRPAAPADGMLRQNIETKETERYQDGKWLPFNVMDKALNHAPQVTIASGSTVNIGAAASNTVNVSGIVPITAFDSIAAGAVRTVCFQGALILTYNATSLILPGAANITTAAGDVATFISLGSGNWRCIGYLRASGSSHNVIGRDQTWQAFTGGTRALGTSYLNNTGRPIQVSVEAGLTANGFTTGQVSGVTVASQRTNGSFASSCSVSFIVPDGAAYQVNSNSSIINWAELR